MSTISVLLKFIKDRNVVLEEKKLFFHFSLFTDKSINIVLMTKTYSGY